MSKKREARAAYYQGLKEALNEHMATTENGLRSLPGLTEKKVDKIVASVRKRHEKLIRQIDEQFAQEIASDAYAASGG